MQNFHNNQRIMLPLRGVALLFTLVELGLTAYGTYLSSILCSQELQIS